jgi:hypothetical protein
MASKMTGVQPRSELPDRIGFDFFVFGRPARKRI